MIIVLTPFLIISLIIRESSAAGAKRYFDEHLTPLLTK